MSKSDTHKKALGIYQSAIGDSPTSEEAIKLEWLETDAGEAEAVTEATVASHLQREGSLDGLPVIIAKAYANAEQRFKIWQRKRRR